MIKKHELLGAASPDILEPPQEIRGKTPVVFCRNCGTSIQVSEDRISTLLAVLKYAQQTRGEESSDPKIPDFQKFYASCDPCIRCAGEGSSQADSYRLEEWLG